MGRPAFLTLGPSGTCHENALLRYLEFQGLDDARVELVADFIEGLELVRERADTFLVQCSAHPDVHVVTERYRQQVFVVDTFLYPAKEMGLLVRAGVREPRSLGIVAAARGYVDEARWPDIVEEPANPLVARNLLAGHYDAGVTLVEYAERDERLRVLERFGEVDTTWLVYGRRRRFAGELIGQPIPWFFTGARDADSRPESERARAA
jgi:hypothetical protein